MCESLIDTTTRSELHVAFITSFGGEFVTSESIPAVKLAADIINADEAILPRHKLVIDVIESDQLPVFKKFINSVINSEVQPPCSKLNRIITDLGSGQEYAHEHKMKDSPRPSESR